MPHDDEPKPPRGADYAELFKRMRATPPQDLREKVADKDDMDEEEQKTKKLQKQLERQSHEDDHNIERALKIATRRVTSSVGWVFSGLVVIFGLLVALLIIKYMIGVSEDPVATKDLLGKLIEWALVILSGFFLEHAFHTIRRK